MEFIFDSRQLFGAIFQGLILGLLLKLSERFRQPQGAKVGLIGLVGQFDGSVRRLLQVAGSFFYQFFKNMLLPFLVLAIFSQFVKHPIKGVCQFRNFVMA